MPPPAEPHIPSVTAGLSAQEAADADPDYLYFLRHVRLDGDAYTVVIPSEDGASSPAHVIRYEQPLPDHNAGPPVAGSKRGGKRAPPPPEENSWATSEAAPHAVKVKKRKAPDASPGGEVRSGAVPMEEDTPTAPVAEPAWYDSPDIDEDYRFFLRHAREVNGKLVFKTGNCSVTIGDYSDAEEEDDGTEEEGKEEAGEGEEDDEEEEDDLPASGQSGEEAVHASETEDGVDSDLPILKVKDEEVSNEEEYDGGPGSDLQIINDPVFYETEKVEEAGEKPLNALVRGTADLDPLGKKVEEGGEKPLNALVRGTADLDPLGKKVEGGEKPLNALARGTTDLDPLGKKEASSTEGHLAMPLNASELQGVIWPPHINERPNSVFKEKLIEVLIKPFTQEEYDKYFALATDRSPLLKERRTRNKVAYYPWTHEMNKSYFDRYPDLAEQFSLQCNNHRNGLALLRGLFFWLQNVGQEDQFRPWSDAFKKYRVVTLNE